MVRTAAVTARIRRLYRFATSCAILQQAVLFCNRLYCFVGGLVLFFLGVLLVAVHCVLGIDSISEATMCLPTYLPPPSPLLTDIVSSPTNRTVDCSGPDGQACHSGRRLFDSIGFADDRAAPNSANSLQHSTVAPVAGGFDGGRVRCLAWFGPCSRA